MFLKGVALFQPLRRLRLFALNAKTFLPELPGTDVDGNYSELYDRT
jgi:hypothetical protein